MSQSTTPARRGRLRTILVTMVTCGLLGLLLGALAGHMASSGGDSYSGSQMLGVVPSNAGTAEGAMAASKQWATVGAAPSFQHEIADRIGMTTDELSAAVKVTSGESAQVITVAAKSGDQAKVQRMITTVSQSLTEGAAKSDARYPLRPLTGIAIDKAAKPSAALVGTGVFLASLVVGALLSYLLVRGRGRHSKPSA